MKKIISLALALLIFLLAGCGPEGTVSDHRQTTGVTNATGPSDPSHIYEEVSDKITIDAVLEYPEPDWVPAVYEASHPVLNRETVDRFLAAVGDSVAEVTTDEYLDELCTWNFFANTEKNGLVGLNYRVGSQDVTNYTFNYSVTGISKWYNHVLCYYNKYDRAEYPDYSNAEKFMEPKDFAFATAEEAEAQVRALLELLGIHNPILTETLYLDHETLAVEEKSEVANAKMTGKGGEPEYKPEWTEADDAYHFYYLVGHEGIPVVHGLDSGRSYRYFYTGIRVIYNRDGVVYLQISNPWAFGQQVETAESILTPQEAVEEAREILSLTQVPHRRVVKEVSLRYYYKQEGEKVYLRPCWFVAVLGLQVQDMFQGQNLNEPYDRYEYIVLDAITGQEY